MVGNRYYLLRVEGDESAWPDLGFAACAGACNGSRYEVMKIAIIGTGISGNVVAHHLHKNHDITVYEANDYIGGHTHTHDLDVDDKKLRIDSGFIVFNQRTYPNFIALLETLGIEKQKSNMSFSVKCEKTGL